MDTKPDSNTKNILRIWSRRGWGIPALSILLLIFLIVAGTYFGSFNSQSQAQADTELNGPEPDERLQRSLDEKATMAARLATAQAGDGQVRAQKSLSAGPGLPLVQDPNFRSGIIEGEPGPFYAGEFIVKNLWQDEKDGGGYIQVYAGALGADPDQGVVVVIILSAEKRGEREIWILTPDRIGGVSVIKEQDNRLLLRAIDGTEYWLDIATQELFSVQSQQ